MPRPRTRRRERRTIPQGPRLHLLDLQQYPGQPHRPGRKRGGFDSSGTAGFRGSRKGTAFAAQRAAEQAARRGVDMGMRNIDVYIKGRVPAGNRPSAPCKAPASTSTASGDVTPIPHNGVRPPKRRRV